jgi:tellurite methyltransferase
MDDAVRWNQRYQNGYFGHIQKPRSILVDHIANLPNQGLALDLAMGLGSNAHYLLDHGLKVIGIDISLEAARRAKFSRPALNAVCADLTDFTLPRHTFDVILNFYYLQRNLIATFSDLLKPGGIVIIETLTTDMRQTHPDLNPDFLLNPGEILELFKNWKMIYYQEGWTASDHGKMKAVASLVAQAASA